MASYFHLVATRIVRCTVGESPAVVEPGTVVISMIQIIVYVSVNDYINYNKLCVCFNIADTFVCLVGGLGMYCCYCQATGTDIV